MIKNELRYTISTILLVRENSIILARVKYKMHNLS